MDKAIGITFGDPDGIGPEVSIKSILARASTNPNQPIKCYVGPNQDTSAIQNLPYVTINRVTPPSNHPGHIAFACIEMAINDALSKSISAIVTAPISKTNLAKAGVPFPDHTTMLKQLTHSTQVSMAFWSPTIKTVLTTIHIPLSTVPSALTEEALQTAAHNATLFAQKLGITSPRIAIAGLNPHASENGLIGTEETHIIQPFITTWNQTHSIPILGPFPPDTLYHQAHKGHVDVVISLYHDQGLIPIKLLAFDQAVNITLGLPFIRTSPDHGTAMDIAHKHIANPTSMINAITLAETLSSNEP